MEDKYYKYPKTWHFDYSKPDAHGNDRVHIGTEHFIGKEVVITEKLDGENTTMYSDKLHARSIDSGHHPSRAWVKAFHARIKYNIPDGLRICGENMQAKHAIYYDSLPSYFFLFGIYNDKNICLSWEDTKEAARIFGIPLVPVLYEGVWDQEKAHACYTGKSNFGSEQEGYVVRLKDSFHYNDFANSVSKYVRPGHVAGDTEHWTKVAYKPNRLKMA